MRFAYVSALIAATCVFASLTSVARAEELEGVRVVGQGVVNVPADVAEIQGTIVGSAELAGDAIVKFRDGRRHVEAALEKLEMEGLSVSGSGMELSSGSPQTLQQMMMGRPNQQVQPQVTVSEALVIRLEGIDQFSAAETAEKLIKITDAAKDAGMAVGASPKTPMEAQITGGTAALATFKLSEPKLAREKAYAAAMADARERATRLAKLSNVTLGKVTGISEAIPATADSQPIHPYIALLAAAGGGNAQSSAEPESERLGDIPVAIELTVTFDID